MTLTENFRKIEAHSLIRRLLLSWLVACVVEFFLTVPHDLHATQSLQNMSLLRLSLLTLVFSAVLQGLNTPATAERIALLLAVCALCAGALIFNFSAGLLLSCLALAAILAVYALRGCDARTTAVSYPKHAKPWWYLTIAALAACVFLFLSVWTVCRVLVYYCSTYDFGLFSQMFHSMKTTGAPVTTLERSKELSHFAVHVSPIYYLMLPFYCLYPTPQTLQVLQAAVVVSAVIPMWKLCRLHGLTEFPSLLLCAVLLVFPAILGGVGYDLHENCFLTPLVLWLLYAMDAKKRTLCIIFAFLVLMVKEDAAVYVAVAALWLIGKTVRQKGARQELWLGVGLLIGAIAWFSAATSFLEHYGDGVMSNRYDNFMYGGSGSLLNVVKAVLLCPMKALAESFEKEKLGYVLKTLLPLLFLPFFTRKYERFILLIPYFLINLMSDYPYQHDLSFQYSFGSAAFLLYLTAVNLADLPKNWLRKTLPAVACIAALSVSHLDVYPTAELTVEDYRKNKSIYERIDEGLSQIEEDAVVASGGFFTTALSARETIYDIYYCTPDQLLSAQYVVLDPNLVDDYKLYATHDGATDGFVNLQILLAQNGYRIVCEVRGRVIIYRRW